MDFTKLKLLLKTRAQRPVPCSPPVLPAALSAEEAAAAEADESAAPQVGAPAPPLSPLT